MALAKTLMVLSKEREDIRSQRGSDSGKSTAFGSGFGYAAETDELYYAKSYRDTSSKEQFWSSLSETPAAYREAAFAVQGAINILRPKTVIDFGVSYGWVENHLAETNKDVNFIGIDRSTLTSDFNDNLFSKPNLSFLAADIFAHLDTRSDWSDTVLFHMRTLTLLPQDFCENFYKTLARKNFLGIVGIEQYGLSRETLTPFVPRTEQQPSVRFRSGMHLHNYPHMLRSAGFEVRYFRFVPTNHAAPDFYFQSFLATRK